MRLLWVKLMLGQHREAFKLRICIQQLHGSTLILDCFALLANQLNLKRLLVRQNLFTPKAALISVFGTRSEALV